jgi:hypothetical protein
MNWWKGAIRVFWKVAKPVVPLAIQAATAAAGVPMVGTWLNAALYAQDRADSGPERFTVGLAALQVAAPLVIDQLERQLGVDIPEDAAAAYTRAQLQAHVDLLNACGLLPRKGA